MKRFTNSRTAPYHHHLISNFSRDNKFLVSNVAKGYGEKEYSWIADFLFKNTGNLSINPHIGYLSFVGDRDIMYQEYGNVEKVWSNYNFFSYLDRSILSESSYELETKQYSKIGQKYFEFDFVEYLNLSDLLVDPPKQEVEDDYRIRHEFYRSPTFYAVGYKINLDSFDFYPPYGQYLYYDIYIWGDKLRQPLDVDNNPRIKSEVGDYFLKFILNEIDGSPDFFNSEYNDGKIIFNDYVDQSIESVSRLIDYKIHVDNPRYAFFEEDVKEIVVYYNESEHYHSGNFYPYYGLVNFYDLNFIEISPYWTYELSSEVVFFPEIIQNGLLEPAKISAFFEYSTPSKGYLCYNPGNHANESTDQSRIVYNVCRRMINYVDPLDPEPRFIVQRKDDADNIIYAGIDLDTERNRRYSAIVMAEPYMVAEPIASGELVEYSFVDVNGNPVNFHGIESEFVSNSKMYLKVTANMNVLTELNDLLSQDDYNTDIIDTMIMLDPKSKLLNLSPSGSIYYEKFGIDENVFLRRQDDCIDDLVRGIVGYGNHKVFTIEAIGPRADKYSDGTMKVNGMGYAVEMIKSISGVISEKESLRFYCSNYTPINSPEAGQRDPAITIDNDFIEILDDASKIDTYKQYEKFRPFIKLPGMNGYIKILSKNYLKTIRTADGKYEMFYNVEFPYCPGSYFSRVEMNFQNYPKLKGFIYKKRSYINAGSWEMFADERYDAGNDRYVPYSDDSFVQHSILLQYAERGDVITDPNKVGGKLHDVSESQLRAIPKNRLHYPSDIVWREEPNFNLLSLIKPRHQEFSRYGTYDIRLDEVRRDGVVEGVTIGDQYSIITEDGSSSRSSMPGEFQLELNVAHYLFQVFSDVLEPGSREKIASIDLHEEIEDINAFRIKFKNDNSPFHNYTVIQQIDLYQDNELFDRTIFKNGMNGWIQTEGIDLIINSDFNLALKPDAAQVNQVITKIMQIPLKNADKRSISIVISTKMTNQESLEECIEQEISIEAISFPSEKSYLVRFVPPYDEQTDDHLLSFGDVEVGGSELNYFSRDMKLFGLVDNRQWKFAENDYVSYINRENPCYVFEIDVNALLNDYSEHQKNIGAIPDNKRWLFGYVSAFASTRSAKDLTVEDETTEKVTTMKNVDDLTDLSREDLSTEESGSDIVIEIWDTKSKIGEDITGGNWRPLSSVDQDILKIPGNIIADDVYISGHLSSGADDPAPIIAPEGYGTIYRIWIGCNPSSGDFQFPPYINYGSKHNIDSPDVLNGRSNLILYDKKNHKSMHIVYMDSIKGDPVLERDIYRVYVMNEENDFILFNPDNPEEDRSDIAYQIRSSDKFISKNTDASTFTRKAVDEIENGFINRFIDFRGSGDPYSDFDRYVVDGKINFRVRVKKKSNYPVSFSNEDESQISYVGQAISRSIVDVGINFPWSDIYDTNFDEQFKWDKYTGDPTDGVNAKPIEFIRKFGLNYFKCGSK